jgi:hypothetical protein
MSTGQQDYKKALAWMGGVLSGLMRKDDCSFDQLAELTDLDPKFIQALCYGQVGGVGHLVWDRIAKALDVPTSIFDVPQIEKSIIYDRKLRSEEGSRS